MIDTQKLRQRILDLAIRGKLVPQDPNDEPASILLDRIRAEKERLIAEGKIKRPKAKKITTDTPHYQNSEPPFEIPTSWQWVTIADICSKIGSGSTPKGSNYSNNGIPFFRSQNVYNEGLVYDDIKYISEIIHASMNGTEVQANDLLLNITGGSLGRCAVVPKEFKRGNVSQHVCIMRPVLVDSNFFQFLVLSSDFSKSMNLTGSGREGLPKYNLETMNFPLPPLQEQKRIVYAVKSHLKILDKIDCEKKNLEYLINSAKSKILELAVTGKLVPQNPDDEPASELLRRINPKAEIVTDNGQYPQMPGGWCFCHVGDVCNYGQNQQIPVESIEGYEWILELEDIEKDSGRILVQHKKSERAVNGSRNRFTKGDVLYSKLRTYLNKVLVAPMDGFCSTEIVVIKCDEAILPGYLSMVLRSPRFLEYTASCGYGVKMPRLSTNDARKGIVLLPPKPEQQKILDKVSNLYSVLDSISGAL